MKKLFVLAVASVMALGLNTTAFADTNTDTVTQLVRLNSQLTSTLEAYATDASVCKTINFTSVADETNAAIEAGLADGSEDAAFDAQEAGKGLKLLMQRCGASAFKNINGAAKTRSINRKYYLDTDLPEVAKVGTI